MHSENSVFITATEVNYGRLNAGLSAAQVVVACQLLGLVRSDESRGKVFLKDMYALTSCGWTRDQVEHALDFLVQRDLAVARGAAPHQHRERLPRL